MKKVLVVEDDVRMQEALREVLSRRFAVSIAQDGFEGLEFLKKKNFDVIITDLKMPKMGGLEFFKKAKNITDAPVIFITAYGTVPIAVEAMKEGAFDFILKPFPVELVEEIVERAITYSRKKKQTKTKKTTTSTAKTKEFIFESEKMKSIVELAEKAATSKATILIEGESGTGKEVLARYIHQKSGRSGPFIAVNCAAIPDTLLESELFGYEKGAFTGAVSSKEGKFELADKGTLLLDEIGDMPLNLQAKLLRVIQEQEVERLGAKTPKKVDVRIIATTNRNLEEMVRKGEFREDLYFRLCVIPIKLPPLRERKEEIIPLAEFFIEKYCRLYNKPIKTLSDEAKKELLEYRWPGNVRELENVIERAVVLSGDSEILDKKDLFIEARKERKQQDIEGSESIQELEKKLISKILDEVGNDIKKASQILGIAEETLRYKIEILGIKKS